MIDIGELMSDPDFAQTIDIQRETGSFVEGEYIKATTLIQGVVAIVQPAKEADLVKFLPEGERQGNWIAIWSQQKLEGGDGQDLIPDVVIWKGEYHRIAKVKHWEANGYYQAWAKGFAQKVPVTP